jgi:hypothetical protein
MQIRPFPWKSLFLAPFASVPALTLTGLGSSDTGVASDFGWGIFFGLLLAVPTAFVGMLLIGIPIFLILRPHKYALMLATFAAGFAIPFLMFSEMLLQEQLWEQLLQVWQWLQQHIFYGHVMPNYLIKRTAYALRASDAGYRER